MERMLDSSHIGVTSDGAVVLLDDELIALERDFSVQAMAGGSNPSCSNSGCGNGSINTVCQNGGCSDSASNSACVNTSCGGTIHVRE